MEYRVVAKVIVVNVDGKVLLLRRSETDIRRPLEWDIPGGHTDGDEFAEEAAVRETKEEAGIEIDPRELKLVYATAERVSEDLNVVWPFYIARVRETTVKLSTEHQEFDWKTLNEVIACLAYERQRRAFEYLRDNNLL